MNIGVCIEPFFDGMSYIDKIKKIKELGYSTYEFWFHDKKLEGGAVIEEEKDFDEIARINEDLGMTLNDFVFNHSEGGIVADLIKRDDHPVLLKGLPAMIERAERVGCPKLICTTGNTVEGMSRETAVGNIVDGLRACAEICEKSGIELILEAFNTRVDHPGYFLEDPYTAIEILEKVGSRKVRMLYDIYHMQIMAGNIVGFLTEHIDWIGHIHIAGISGRNEPFGCELNYPFILKKLEEAGYEGACGLEFFPELESEESLVKTRDYLF
jgi:hydroxypyruvate isomerase